MPNSNGGTRRRQILRTAVDLATVEGLDGLSIGGLAERIGMSKSGLYSHFKSKEELQLAVIDTAFGIYEEHVLLPALREKSGLKRLQALCENFLSYMKLFPGGCFFASVNAEFDTRPGNVRDRLADLYQAWGGALTGSITQAQQEGSLRASEDPEQLAFEVNAYLHLANDIFVFQRNEVPVARAQQALRDRVDRARP
ncbi:TetR/AcrR family transcriptional regulator [Streptomyces sp. NPDC004528]|uniref:TetR/AcrR family transcriptional regulator n=1 Tax=Streptomyces sp. NPDC004528 TaxID=3154550 RepID=UPI0033A4A079